MVVAQYVINSIDMSKVINLQEIDDNDEDASQFEGGQVLGEHHA